MSIAVPIPTRLVNSWSNVLPPFLAHKKWSSIMEEEAINITKLTTDDGMGVVHLLLTPEEFLRKYKKAPIVLVKPPKVPAGASRAVIANSVTDNAAYNQQQQAGSSVLAWMLATIPQEYLDPMMEDDSIHSRSMEYIFTNLRKNIGPLTAQDLDGLKLALTVVHVHPASVLAHITRFLKYLGLLEAANQKVSNSDAVSIMKNGFDINTYLDCFVDFAKKYPDVALQTPAALGEAIIVYTKTVLPVRLGSTAIGASATATSAITTTAAALSSRGYVANSTPLSLGAPSIGASVTATPPDGFVARAEIQDLILQALAAHDARNPGPSNAGTAKPNNRKLGPLYCWTHGPAHTHNGKEYGHSSQDCKSPNPGHCHKATDGRRMRGTEVPAFYRYLEKNK